MSFLASVFLSSLLLVSSPPSPQSTSVVIGKHRFQVELAQTVEEVTRGLMYRERLGKFQGMLFVFPEEAPRSFWMKNTLISLDIIFISQDLRIVSIAERAEPLSLKSLQSQGPARYVLEINGGLSAELKIKPGMKVRIEGLKSQNQPPKSLTR